MTEALPERIYAYGSQGLDDAGWGCVYRSAQNVLSALGVDPMPELPDMMRVLRIPEAASGRHRWIEPKQVRTLLTHYLSPWPFETPRLIGLDVDRHPHRLLQTNLDDFDEMLDRDAFHARVVAHLVQNQVPVVVDDGVVGLCIAGVHGDRYTLLDPHLPGAPVRTVRAEDFYRHKPMLMALVW